MKQHRTLVYTAACTMMKLMNIPEKRPQDEFVIVWGGFSPLGGSGCNVEGVGLGGKTLKSPFSLCRRLCWGLHTSLPYLDSWYNVMFNSSITIFFFL